MLLDGKQRQFERRRKDLDCSDPQQRLGHPMRHGDDQIGGADECAYPKKIGKAQRNVPLDTHLGQGVFDEVGTRSRRGDYHMVFILEHVGRQPCSHARMRLPHDA